MKKNIDYNVSRLYEQGKNLLLLPRSLGVRTKIMAFNFQDAKKSSYASQVKSKRVWKMPRLHVCSKAATDIFEGSPLPEKP